MNPLWRRCRPPGRAVLGFVAWTLVETTPVIGSGYLLGRAVDATLRGDDAAAAGSLGLLVGLVAVGMLGARAAFPHLAEIVDTVRDRLTQEVVGGSLRRLATTGRPSSVAVAQVTDQVDQVRSLLATVLRTLRSTVIPLVGVVLGLSALDPRLALVAGVPLAVALAAYVLSLRPLRDRLARSNDAEERLGDELTAVVAAGPALRGLGAQEWAGRRLAGGVHEVAATGLAAARMQAVRHAVVGCGALVPLVGVLVLARVTHDLSAGALLGAVTYLLTVLAPALSALVGGLGGWAVQLQVLMDRLERVARVPAPRPVVPPRLADPAGAVLAARGVGYAYPGAARRVVDGVDLRLAPGELLAVVGPSGCGKSTLARMAVGLLEPTDGAIGVRDDAVVAYVPQEPYVFRGTLLENLGLDRAVPVATVQAAARRVGLGALLDGTGPEDELEPAVLGVAERQRIVLARALVSEPDVLVLDETFAGLGAAEVRDLEAIVRASGAAVVLITHDAALAARADHVVAFDGVA